MRGDVREVCVIGGGSPYRQPVQLVYPAPPAATRERSQLDRRPVLTHEPLDLSLPRCDLCSRPGDRDRGGGGGEPGGLEGGPAVREPESDGGGEAVPGPCR